LQLGCDESCLGYVGSKNHLHNLKAVVRAGELSVIVKRGTYRAECSNYRMNEHNLQRAPSTDRKCIKLQRRTRTYINTCVIIVWLNSLTFWHPNFTFKF
jgi:hypothetical protein